MGLAQALNAVARSVGPLWCKFACESLPPLLSFLPPSLPPSLTPAVDAAYEGPQKRTFLAMAICIACYLLILIGVLVLYPKLVPPLRNLEGHTDTDSESEDDVESLSDSDYGP